MLKYEELLCGKTEFLHSQYKSNCLYYKELIELIEKIKKVYSTFSESIKNIFSKKYNYLEDESNPLYQLFVNIQFHIKSQSNEYKDLSDIISRQIIEPYKKVKHVDEKKEENLYKEIIELNKGLKKIKSKIEENKNIFYTKMIETEKLIFEEKSMKKNSLISSKELKEKENISFDSIFDAQMYEENYIKSIEDANKLINNTNLKEKELLNFYQNAEEERLKAVRTNLCSLLSFTKLTYSKIIDDIENMNKKFVQFDIDGVINSFIQRNKSDSLPLKNIEFIPYKPSFSLDNSLKTTLENELMNINYEVMETLKKFFNGVCENLDMKEEKRRKDFRKLCLSLFDDKNPTFVEEDKDQLINFMKIHEYRKYFLSTLTNQRLNGKFKRNEKLFNELLDILNFILDLAEKEKNFDNARNCIILSQTFYKEVEVDGEIEKVYLMEYIKKNKWLSQVSFWKDIIENDIKEEKLKFEKEEEKRSKEPGKKGGDITNIYFSQLITYSSNMNMFGLPKNEVINIVNYFYEKYNVPDTFQIIVNNNIEIVYTPILPKKKTVIKEKKEKTEKNDHKKEEKIEDDKKKIEDEKKTFEEDKKKIEDDWVIDDFIEFKEMKKEDKKDKINDNNNNKIIMNDEKKENKNEIKKNEKIENKNEINVETIIKTDEEILNEAPLKINEFSDDNK